MGLRGSGKIDVGQLGLNICQRYVQGRNSITRINGKEDYRTTIGKPNAPYNAIKKNGVK
jgi:hypothetical protein